MRTPLLSAILVASVSTLWSASDARGQQRGPAAPTGGIGVIDIGKIFKNHARFKQTMDNLKHEIEAEESALKKERDFINSKVETLQRYKAGTLEYKKLEEEIATRQSDFQVRAGLKKKNFLERESKIYFNVYREVNYEVQDYSRQHNLSLVLRYSSDPPDDSSRDTILRTINQPIVYQSGIDITQQILDGLNRRGGATAPAAGRPRTGLQR